MTIYHSIKAPERRRHLRPILGLVLLTVFLLGLSQVNFRHTLGNLSFKILKPFWNIAVEVDQGWNKTSGLFRTKIKLAQENLELWKIIRQQSIVLLNQGLLEQENMALRQIVNRAEPPRPLTIGRLLSQGLQFPFSTALIDTGFENVTVPLTPGVVVVAEGAVALGELIELSATSAKISFYSAPNNRLNVFLGDNHIPIELIGRGGGNFFASLPRDFAVAVNDRATITIAGHEFLLAIVNDIERLAGDSFQKIFLRVPINISQLTWVEMYEP